MTGKGGKIMKNIITDEIFMQLNEHFKSKGSIISFVKNDINSVYITIKDVYLDSINVYPNKQFYIELEKYLPGPYTLILEKLNSLNIPIYIVPGNNDWTSYKESKWSLERINHYKTLVKGLENLIDVNNKLVNAEEFQFIGHGITSSPEYPQYKEDLKRYNKKELAKIKKDYTKDLAKTSSIFEKSSKPVIFLTHNVPFNTPIDKIVNKESPKNGYHYGSLIARKIIDKYQPLVCIGGHMHEHFAKCKIDKTTAINTGYGSYVNILLELDGNKIKKVEFYKGK